MISRRLDFVPTFRNTLSVPFLGRVNKTDYWDEIARVFIQVKVAMYKYPRRSLSV